jgi:hypothetical protein
VATYLEEQELVKIENKAITVFLPKMGYNRTTARAVVYGLEEHGGIGIKSLYAEQSIAQITVMIQHTRLYSPLGQTICINLDWVQIIAGIQRPVFEDTQPIQHMEVNGSDRSENFSTRPSAKLNLTNYGSHNCKENKIAV